MADTTNCEQEGCPWQTDVRLVPLADPYLGCNLVVTYRFRTCNGFLEIQPISVNLINDPADDLCSTAVADYSNGNSTYLVDLLWRIADAGLGQVLAQEFYDGLTSMQKFQYRCNGGTQRYVIQYVRPACRVICNTYLREGATAPFKTILSNTISCGNACCFVKYEYCYNTTTQLFEKSNVSYQQVGDCGSPINTGCSPINNDTIVTVLKQCTNYCTDTDTTEYGLLHIEDKSTSPNVSIYNVDNKVLQSNALVSTGGKELYLELTSDKFEILPENGLEMVSIYSMNGSVIHSELKVSNLNILQIPVHLLQNGIYTLVLQSKEGSKAVPLIISR